MDTNQTDDLSIELVAFKHNACFLSLSAPSEKSLAEADMSAWPSPWQAPGEGGYVVCVTF